MLALVGLIYVGDSSGTVDVGDNVLESVPGWFICAVNPGAVTVCCFYLSAAVHAFAEACGEFDGDTGVPKWRKIFAMVIVRSYNVIAKVKDSLRRKPGLCVIVCLWLAHGAVSWWFLVLDFGDIFLMCGDEDEASIAATIGGCANSQALATNSQALYVALVVSNVALATGFVMKTVRACMMRQGRPTIVDAPVHSSEIVDSVPRRSCDKSGCSVLSSLLVGWGVGYWITSVLMGDSAYSEGWDCIPFAVEVVGYITIPWFFFAVIFLMADANFLGTKFESFINHTARILRDKRGVWFWILATVIRDVLSIWVYMWVVLVPCLNNI